MFILTPKYKYHFIGLFLLFLLLWVIDMSIGSLPIPFGEVLKFLTFQTNDNATWHTILADLRLPKSLTIIVVGVGLSVSGLLMQTLFRNPMAGPSVLGVSSGASLGVAIFVMGSAWLGFQNYTDWFGQFSIIASAIMGSLLVLILIMLVSVRLKNTLSILIIGLMFSALTSSVVSVLSFSATATQLQRYIVWGFGNVAHLTYFDITILYVFVFIFLIFTTYFLKPLNVILLGENIANSLGINILKTNYAILLSVGIIVGLLTAFVGPIAFIGLSVPHIARMLFKTSNHFILFPAVVFIGAILMLFCDILTQIIVNEQTIPINAVTSMIGAPLVIYLILKQKNYQM